MGNDFLALNIKIVIIYYFYLSLGVNLLNSYPIRERCKQLYISVWTQVFNSIKKIFNKNYIFKLPYFVLFIIEKTMK